MNDPNQKRELRQELENLSPGFPKKPAFHIPDRYFDDLPDQVMARWRETAGAEHRQNKGIYRRLAAAAIVIGLCLGFYWLTQLSTPVSATTAISSADAYQYILDHYDEFEPLLDQQLIPAMALDSSWLDPNEIKQYMHEQLTLEELENLF